MTSTSDVLSWDELRPVEPGLPRRRRRAGYTLALVGVPALTLALLPLRDSLTLGSVLLLYLLTVVMVAVVGGLRPAVGAALVAFVLANYYFTPPYRTLLVESRDAVVALVVFAVVTVLVAVTVDGSARRQVRAARGDAEDRLLARFTEAPVREASAVAVLEQIGASFGLTSVALIRGDGHADADADADGDGDGDADGGRANPVAAIGPPIDGPAPLSLRIDDRLRLEAAGAELSATDQRLLHRLGTAAARAWESQRLTVQAERAQRLAEIDRVRSALLAAVGHDLRTPLAGIKAAVSSLRQDDVTWHPDDESALLETIETCADQLDDLIGNLLAMSRLQAGVLSVALQPVAVDEVVARVLLGGAATASVVLQIDEDTPAVLADPGLLERVVANLLANARRFTPPGTPVEVSAQAARHEVRLRVADHGPGVPSASWEEMFVPFQRLGDSTAGGVGLGLAIARGFTEAMGGSVLPERTPGGGLTMVVTLPMAEQAAGPDDVPGQGAVR